MIDVPQSVNYFSSKMKHPSILNEILDKGDTITGYIHFDTSCYGYPTNQTFFEKFTLELTPLD